MYFVNNIGLNVKSVASNSFSRENNHQCVPNVESQNTIVINFLMYYARNTMPQIIITFIYI